MTDLSRKHDIAVFHGQSPGSQGRTLITIGVFVTGVLFYRYTPVVLYIDPSIMIQLIQHHSLIVKEPTSVEHLLFEYKITNYPVTDKHQYKGFEHKTNLGAYTMVVLLVETHQPGNDTPDHGHDSGK
jgi:hypothetical protein